MSNHDDFLDKYIEYRIFEESMKGSGDKPSKRVKRGSGCGTTAIIVVLVIIVLCVFGSCGSNKKKSSSFPTRTHTALRYILRPQRVPVQAILLTPQRAKQNS